MSDSRERIIDAAIEVFAAKGKYGAHMEEIAARAGVNKAMAYYYFSSKDNLYRETVHRILSRLFNEFTKRLNKILSESNSPDEALRKYIKIDYDIFSENANYTKIVLGALVDEVEFIHRSLEKIWEESAGINPHIVQKILADGAKAGAFRNVDPKQTMISILGLNFIYFVGQHISHAVLNLPVGEEKKFFKERYASVVDLLLYGIIARPQEND